MPMMKRSLFVLMCFLALLALSGCYSRREPKDMGVVNSILYDVKDGQYRVTAEIMNPSAVGGTQQGSSSEQNTNVTVTAEGDSIREAIANLSVSLEKRLFAGHNKVRFFTERFARKDMTAILDFLLRDHLSDETAILIVLRHETPEDIYFSGIGLSDMVGNYVESMEKSQPDHTAGGVFVNTLDFVKDYYDDGKQPVAGIASLKECQEKPSGNTSLGSRSAGGEEDPSGHKIVLYEGLAAFRDNHLVGFMDGTEARAYNFVTNNLVAAFITVPTGSGETAVEIGTSNADIQTVVDGDRVSLDVHIKVSMRVVTAGASDVDVSKSGPLKIVEDAFNQKIAEEVTAAVKKAQEFKSDIFGFGRYVHMQHPREWRDMRDGWDDAFSRADIHVSVESTVDREGEIKQPFALED